MTGHRAHATPIAALLLAVHAAGADRFDTKTASFAVAFHGETSAYRDTAVVVLPGASVIFDAVGGPGMGFYPGTAAHPPFVHVDVRGTAARWKG